MASKLTRNEAGDRARLVEVESYRIDLDLTGGETTFRSRTTVTFRAATPGASTFIDLTAPEVREITLNGSEVGRENFTGHRIRLDGLGSANELTVVADCAYSRTGEGLHRFTDPADKGVYLYSDLETFDAHRIYACFDQPDLKSRFEFTVTCPDTWQVISNMAPDVTAAPAGPGIQALALPALPADVHLHHRRLRPGPITWSAPSTTASRSGSTAASRSRPTWTPTRSSRSPGRASTSSTTRSACGTRSASTTSCSCPSTRPARWRTRAA